MLRRKRAYSLRRSGGTASAYTRFVSDDERRDEPENTMVTYTYRSSAVDEAAAKIRKAASRGDIEGARLAGIEYQAAWDKAQRDGAAAAAREYAHRLERFI
jgi:type IV secretory pathway VirB6-like protein